MNLIMLTYLGLLLSRMSWIISIFAAKPDDAQQTLRQAKPIFQNRSLTFNNLIHLFGVVISIKFSCIKRNEMFTEWNQNPNSFVCRYAILFDSIYLVSKKSPLPAPVHSQRSHTKDKLYLSHL
jgi:hypothetical protein